METLADFTSIFPVSDKTLVPKFQAIINAVRETQQLAGDAFDLFASPNGQVMLKSRATHFAALFVAVIVDQGPSAANTDYTDERYYAKVSHCLLRTPGAPDPEGRIFFDPQEPPKDASGDYVTPFIITVTNLAEIPLPGTGDSATHTLPIGMAIPVFGISDASPTPTPHYFTFANVGGGGAMSTGQFTGQIPVTISPNSYSWQLIHATPIPANG